jgi:hypothetical protein
MQDARDLLRTCGTRSVPWWSEWRGQNCINPRCCGAYWNRRRSSAELGFRTDSIFSVNPVLSQGDDHGGLEPFRRGIACPGSTAFRQNGRCRKGNAAAVRLAKTVCRALHKWAPWTDPDCCIGCGSASLARPAHWTTSVLQAKLVYRSPCPLVPEINKALRLDSHYAPHHSMTPDCPFDSTIRVLVSIPNSPIENCRATTVA